MSLTANIESFTSFLEQSVNEGSFIKLTLSNKKDASSDLNNVYVKPVMIKDKLMLSFTDRFKTKDITRNLEITDAKNEISKLLEENFNQGYLATIVKDYHLLTSKKGNSTLLQKPPASTKAPTLKHDKEKERPIKTAKNHYLHALGVLNDEWKVRPDKQDKYRQINKYIEIVDGILKDANLEGKISVADMGSGKGYLTFALYDYLTNQLKKDAVMTGIEFREDLVVKCNRIAEDAGFAGLSFKEGTIETTDLPPVNILIALHACNTATDEAIYRGITSGAEIIVCSPCCHKQVRKDMKTEGTLSEITKFGILEERQAEILTDTIRALTLEAYGYKTNVAEFVATEHTPKNLIISAVKKRSVTTPDEKVVEKINDLKAQFNISRHHLQELLKF
jgi:hypothetical protein